MSQSIIQTTKECFFTGSTDGLHKHHCIPGTANRTKSEKYGLWVWLRADIHNKIHADTRYTAERTYLEKLAQTEFEKRYSRELWMKEFHKNYLGGSHEVER